MFWKKNIPFGFHLILHCVLRCYVPFRLKKELVICLSLSPQRKRRLSTWCWRRSAVSLGSSIKIKRTPWCQLPLGAVTCPLTLKMQCKHFSESLNDYNKIALCLCMSVYTCVAIFYQRVHLFQFVFFVSCSLLKGQRQAVLASERGVMDCHTADVWFPAMFFPACALLRVQKTELHLLLLYIKSVPYTSWTCV